MQSQSRDNNEGWQIRSSAVCIWRYLSEEGHPCRRSQTLHHDGSRNSSRTLWIDAICIDQRNLEERNKQVLHMKSLFQNASCVLMWLGTANRDDQIALQALSNMGNHAVSFSEEHSKNTNFPDYTKAKCIDCPLSNVENAVWRRIGSVFTDRPYWERHWVFQEVLLSKTASVVCGHTTLPICWKMYC